MVARRSAVFHSIARCGSQQQSLSSIPTLGMPRSASISRWSSVRPRYPGTVVSPSRPLHSCVLWPMPSASTAFSSLSVLPGSPLVVLLERTRIRVEPNVGGPFLSRKTSPGILALSSRTAVSSKVARMLRRWLSFFQSWMQAAWKAFLVGSRSAEVFLRFSPLAIMAPVAALTQSSWLTEHAWRYTISMLQALGPVAVKFSQWVATRRDIFPPFLCDRLGVLHDSGYPHSWDHTHRVLTEAFGDYRAKGLMVDEVIGCGSAAQVYRGRLLETKKGPSHEDQEQTTTREVAIKVLHPHFSGLVERDLSLMETVADFLHALPSDLIRLVNLPKATANFGTVLRLQADLHQEANNLRQFRSNFYENRPDQERRSSITFPRPLTDWSSEKVLVEDYVHDAQPIAAYLQDSTPKGIQLRKELAGPLLRAFLKMVFIDNFVHGDLHPGNVMVRTEVVPTPSSGFLDSFFGNRMPSENDSSTIRRTIVFLDAGIANSLSPKDQRNLIDLFRAIIFNDGDRAGRLMVERANYERCSQVPGGVDSFAKGVEEIVSEFHDRRKEGLTLGAVRIGGLLSRVLDLCRIHGVEIDPAMASVVISTLVLEGLGRSLSPDLNLIDFARPFVMGRGKV